MIDGRDYFEDFGGSKMVMMEDANGTTVYKGVSTREVVSQKDVEKLNESVMDIMEENNKMLKKKCARLERENSYLKRVLENIKGLLTISEGRICIPDEENVSE